MSTSGDPAGAGARAGAGAAGRRLVLVAAIMGSFVAGLDATAVNVGLPAIQHDLGGGLAGQQWISNAYLLSLGSLILVGGSLGDVFGERRIFGLGVAGFGATSLVCAGAPSIELLVGARAVQGVFGALLTPSALAVIVNAFPPAERGAAIGSWTAWSGIAAVVGPFVGGALIDAASWRWIFGINVPFVIATLVLVRMAIPAGVPGGRHRKVDWAGAVLCAGGLAGPVYALIRQPAVGWSSAEVAGSAVGGVVLLGIFFWREARIADPMLPLGLFGRRNFAVGNLETLAMYGGLSITFFMLVLFLQQVAGFGALEAGLATLPSTLVMFGLSKRFGGLADRFGPRRFMGAGPLIAAAGLAWLARMPARVDYAVDVLPGLLVFSVGLAMTVAPLTATVLADADESNAGIASGVNNAVARVAGLLAIAATGAVVAGTFASQLDTGLAGRPLSAGGRAAVASARHETLARADTSGLGPGEARVVAGAVEAASVRAFHTGIGIGAGLVALGGLLGLAGIVDRRRPVAAAGCSGGQLAGAPEDVGECWPVPGPIGAGSPVAVAAATGRVTQGGPVAGAGSDG